MIPIVSVIIPTRNRAAMLREAIESVRAQTYAAWELIVIDDGSTDETPQVVEALARGDARIRVMRQAQRGVSAARNAGIRAARGRYVAFLDDDDLFLPPKLAAQVDALERDPTLGFVYSQTEWVDRAGTRLSLHPTTPVEDLRGLFETCAIPLQTVVCCAELLEEVGGFDEQLTIGEDYDLWLRLARTARFQFLPGPLVRYRVHGTNTCNDSIRLYEQRAVVLGRVPLDPARGITRWVKRRRVSENAYRLARLYRDRAEAWKAGASLWRAVRQYPLIGMRVAESRPAGWRALWMSVKPYAAIVLCLANSGTQYLFRGRADYHKDPA
jgi:glycosyltransferase involved in cell wall biosynthesis